MKWLKDIIMVPYMYWYFSRMRGIRYIEFFAWMGFGLVVGLMF